MKLPSAILSCITIFQTLLLNSLYHPFLALQHDQPRLASQCAPPPSTIIIVITQYGFLQETLQFTLAPMHCFAAASTKVVIELWYENKNKEGSVEKPATFNCLILLLPTNVENRQIK